jgi:predicted permease
MLASILVALAPALRSTRSGARPDLKGEGLSSSGGRLAGRRLLVSVQVALSVMLLIGAGLFVRSLRNLRTLDPGFDRQNVLILRMDPTLSGYKPERVKPFFREVLNRVRTLPAVRGATYSWMGLIDHNHWGSGIRVEGFTPREGDPGPLRNVTGPDYFHTLAMPLLAGRDFDDHDNQNGPRVAIVNEQFARFYFGDQNPIGRQIGAQDPGEPANYTIVGVAKDGRYASLREPPPRFWYIPYEQGKAVHDLHLYVRTVGDPLKMTAAVRHEIAAVDTNVPVYGVKTLEIQIDEDLVTDRLLAALSSLFSLLAALLASIGLYGVMAYSVTRRTREIGIRMALGAEQGQVMWMVLREVVMLVTIGIAAGVPAAWLLKRLIASILFDVPTLDLMAVAGATVLMALVALLAGYLPARRATKVDPMVALRHE